MELGEWATFVDLGVKGVGVGLQRRRFKQEPQSSFWFQLLNLLFQVSGKLQACSVVM